MLIRRRTAADKKSSIAGASRAKAIAMRLHALAALPVATSLLASQRYPRLMTRRLAAPVATPAAEALQADVNRLLAPFGAPALFVPAKIAAAVDAKCLELEQSTTKPPLEALDGAWRVVYSNAPSPSNGALGPLRGDGLQIVDVAKRRYANELRLFGGNARVTLEATFTGDAEELRVTFRSIRLVLFGNQIIEKQFPPGVERTWCLSYTDASCRVVRAGVDGGRSLVREAGLVDKNAGEAKDAYLFFMERAADYVAD